MTLDTRITQRDGTGAAWPEDRLSHLVRELQSPQVEVRREVSWALSEQSEDLKPYAPALYAAFEDADPEVRANVRRALKPFFLEVTRSLKPPRPGLARATVTALLRELAEDALSQRDASKLAKALRLGLNAKTDELGGKWLARAAQNEDARSMTLLLEAGAPPNSGGGAPLAWAVRVGNESLVGLLLEKGADPNLEQPGDGRPLHFVKDTAIAKRLLQFGADRAQPDAQERLAFDVQSARLQARARAGDRVDAGLLTLLALPHHPPVEEVLGQAKAAGDAARKAIRRLATLVQTRPGAFPPTVQGLSAFACLVCGDTTRDARLMWRPHEGGRAYAELFRLTAEQARKLGPAELLELEVEGLAGAGLRIEGVLLARGIDEEGALAFGPRTFAALSHMGAALRLALCQPSAPAAFARLIGPFGGERELHDHASLSLSLLDGGDALPLCARPTSEPGALHAVPAEGPLSLSLLLTETAAFLEKVQVRSGARLVLSEWSPEPLLDLQLPTRLVHVLAKRQIGFELQVNA